MIPAPRSAIGADPGVQGGVVELARDGRRVVRWAAWHRQGENIGLISSGRGRRLFATLGEALRVAIEPVDGAIAAVEDLFIPRILTADGETSPGEIGALYLAAGRLVGILERDLSAPVLRPTSGAWRKEAWGKWGRSRADAKAAALEMAPLLGDWAIDNPFACDADLTEDEVEGIAEAFGIARWAWAQWRHAPQAGRAA